MSNKKSKQTIRKQAEKMIQVQDTQVSQSLEKLSLDKTKNIVHELEVHQIELELQNEELLRVQGELEKTKKRYFDLYDMAPIGYCTLNENGLIEEVNLQLSDLLGQDRDKLIKQPLAKFIYFQDQDTYYTYRKKLLTSQEKQECELRIVKVNDTKPCWVYLSAVSEMNKVRLVIKDISERKIFEENLKLFASVFKNAGEAIMLTGFDGTIQDINEAFTKITGYEKEEVIGSKPSILKSGLQSKQYYRSMWKTLKSTGSWTGEIWNKKKNGQIYAEMLIINTVYDYRGKASHFVALFSDITGIKEYENSLKNIAHFDQLTKLPNRVLLTDRLENGILQIKRNKQHLAVVFLDLDGFKDINDTFGHDVGDKLLIELSKEMKQSLREVDTLARIGGDEFVAVLFDLVEVSDALPIIMRLLESCSKKIEIDDNWVQVSASLGISSYPQNHMLSPDLLLRQADQAMYQAKLSGKNCYHFFDTEENNLVRERYEGIEQIRQALKNEEFILYYQPKVNMRTGEVIGAEALIRWQHPEKGLVPPLEFLPVVDGHSLSIDIGEWVLHTALSQIQLFQQQGINIAISVNIDALQLLNNNFVDRLKNILLQYPSVNPNMLELEVLETNRLEDISTAKEVMNKCIKLGVSFSLDDFGTGYSSLIYLKRLPIKQIKIDRSFVQDMLSDPNDLSILEGIIGLSEAFQRSVIAEGIEASEHAETLLGLGCELGQGYAISYPLPAEKFIKWFEEYTPNSIWKQQTLMDNNQKKLLFINVHLHAWIQKIKAILNDEENEDIDECHFGQWLLQDAEQYLGSSYQEIDLKHKNIHQFADELLALHNSGNTTKALAGLDELYGLRDELIHGLQRVM